MNYVTTVLALLWVIGCGDDDAPADATVADAASDALPLTLYSHCQLAACTALAAQCEWAVTDDRNFGGMPVTVQPGDPFTTEQCNEECEGVPRQPAAGSPTAACETQLRTAFLCLGSANACGNGCTDEIDAAETCMNANGGDGPGEVLILVGGDLRPRS